MMISISLQLSLFFYSNSYLFSCILLLFYPLYTLFYFVLFAFFYFAFCIFPLSIRSYNSTHSLILLNILCEDMYFISPMTECYHYESDIISCLSTNFRSNYKLRALGLYFLGTVERVWKNSNQQLVYATHCYSDCMFIVKTS